MVMGFIAVSSFQYGEAAVHQEECQSESKEGFVQAHLMFFVMKPKQVIIKISNSGIYFE